MKLLLALMLISVDASCGRPEYRVEAVSDECHQVIHQLDADGWELVECKPATVGWQCIFRKARP